MHKTQYRQANVVEQHQAQPQDRRGELTGEHRIGDIGQIVLACVFGIVWIVDTFFLGYTTFLNRHIPFILRILPGLFVLLLSGYLAKRGLRIVFGEVHDKPGVIRKGVFGIVRHPIYLGEILLYLGLLMLSISLAATAVWLLAIGFLHYISRHEEKLLLSRFGAEYEQYMREVSMWIPRFGRKRRG